MGQTFPLGTSNFRLLREDESLYVDKTKIIEQMEKDSRYITFLRPRRFGKSLLVSTLSYYYDIKAAHLFEKLFAGQFRLLVHRYRSHRAGSGVQRLHQPRLQTTFC